MIYCVAYVVEGHGEVQALPILLRRIGASLVPPVTLCCPTPVRVRAPKLLNPSDIELERSIELAAAKAHQSLAQTGEQGVASIHIVLDREQDTPTDCPARLGPELLRRASGLRSDTRLAVTLAKQEFEAWLIGAAESLSGRRSLPEGLTAPPEPEAIRGAKEWLSERMGRRYQERLDQPALAAVMDMDLARKRSDSFDKYYRDTLRLISE